MGSPVAIPNGRTIGPAIAVAIDPAGHIWLLHLCNYFAGTKPDEQARAARLPPVVEFDSSGAFHPGMGRQRSPAQRGWNSPVAPL